MAERGELGAAGCLVGSGFAKTVFWDKVGGGEGGKSLPIDLSVRKCVCRRLPAGLTNPGRTKLLRPSPGVNFNGKLHRFAGGGRGEPRIF